MSEVTAFAPGGAQRQPARPSLDEVHVDDLQFERRPWNGMQAYSDSKLWDVVLAFAVARRFPSTLSNAVDPGWIKTRMGGAGATDGESCDPR